jgi:hypothetical protein
MALPTFVIGGAPKAGTTALWTWLSEHPQVWMSPIKEPHFLTRDVNDPVPGVHIVGAPRADTFGRGIAWYEGLFEQGRDRPARGEASTHYLGATDGPELMNRFVPGLKVVFVLRQPVDRTVSHYWHNRKRGHALPDIARLADEPSLRYLLYMSRYRQHLERYFEGLGPGRIHLVLFDDLRSDPAAAYAGICRFIGVADDHRPAFAPERNPHGLPKSAGLQHAIARTTYLRWRFLPAPVRARARRLRSRMEAWNVRRATSPPLPPELRSRLMAEFAEDIRYVEERTRPLPDWWSEGSGKARNTDRSLVRS